MSILRRLPRQPCGTGLREQDRSGSRRTSEQVPAEVRVRGMVAQPRAVVEEVAGREWTGDLFWR